MSKIFGIEIGRRQAVVEMLPPWRADFRRKGELPDLKVVRTHFLLNYGVAGIALGVAGYAGWCEYQYAELRSEIGQLGRALEAGRAADRDLLAQSALYSEYAKTGAEFAKFKGVALDCQKAMAELGAIRADGMTIKTVSVDANFFNTTKKREEVRIAVIGTQRLEGGAAAFDAVTDSYRRFRELKLWTGVKGRKPDSSPTPSKVATNLQDHVIEFTFELSLVEGAK